MNIKTNLAHKENYGSKRSLSDIKYIVIHYTANDGDTDENNGKYFRNNVTKTSAHYFVDDDSITQSVPDDYIAYHCGAKTYKHVKCRNQNSIGVELCDDVKDGVVYPSAKTIENAVEFVNYLMKKYNISKVNVIRHYDVTGKKCPAYWVDNTKWKTEFWNKLGGSTTNVPYKVRVTADSLNIRNGAGVKYDVIGVVNKGDVFTISKEKNGWGKPKWYFDNNKEGWVKLSYTKKI